MSEARIQELEAEVARLRAMLARAGVQVLPAAELPDEEECAVLINAVINKYPMPACRDDLGPRTYRAQFDMAMHYLAYAGRSEKADSKYAVSFWLEEARAFLDKNGLPNTMLFAPFVCACIASGILFEPFVSPAAVTLGLQLGSTGRPSSAWRRSLTKIPDPQEPRRPLPTHKLIQTNIVEGLR